MATSILYAANTIPQDVAIGENINFGTPVRRYGKNITMSGGNILTSGAGYYEGDVRLDFVGAAGTTVFTVMENGVPIPGAKIAITTAAGTAYNATIPFVTRNKCCLDGIISVEVSGASITDATVAIVVEKV